MNAIKKFFIKNNFKNLKNHKLRYGRGDAKYNPTSKTKAFTLAEVLITLAIIGVVAALVIPATISKVNRLQVESGLPVAYQNLKQIIAAAEQDEGPMEEWSIRSREEAKNTNYAKDAAENYFIPYVQGTRYEYKTIRQFGYEKGVRAAVDGREVSSGKFPIMMLPNGMIAIFTNATGAKQVFNPSSGKTDKMGTPSTGLKIYVDINGFKKPNAIGKDIFDFEIYLEEESKLSMSQHLRITTGLPEETWEDLKNAYENDEYKLEVSDDHYVITMCMNYSSGCAAWIMRNGWKIPENYPWL